MKRKLLLLIILIVTTWSYGQYTAIPDPNFEQALIDQGYDSEGGAVDGQILTTDIQNITFLNLTGDPNFNVNQNEIGLGITDLTGIKDFGSLQVLWVQGNDLTVLDVEGMSSLLDIRAFFNDLEQININGLINLEIIGLNVNNLSGINVSTNTSLEIFDIAQNNLLGLDISGLSNLTNMNVQDNPNLSCIQVESAATATSLNGNTNFRKNGATVFSNSCPSIYTQIPDRNFESALISNGIDTQGGIPNGLVLTADISNQTNLDISNQGVTDLTGLEAFTSLEILDVSNNNLNALRLQNLSLIEIYANNTNVAGGEIFFQNVPSGLPLSNVTTLELINNSLGNASSNFSFGGVPNVQTLNISGNNFGTLTLGGQTDYISNLIASNCPNLNNLTGLGSLSQLQELTITNSNFTSLDFTGLDLLSTLRVDNNNFESLNLKDIDDTLTTLNAIGNVNLSCIEVSNVGTAQAQGGWQKDDATEYRTDCSTVQPFLVSATLTGAGIGPNFSVNEGESFSIEINALSDEADGQTFSYAYVPSGISLDDYTPPPNPSSFTVNSSQVVDGRITFEITDDNIPNEGETIIIELFEDNENWNWENASANGTRTFEIKINDALTNAPLIVEAQINGTEGSAPNYSIREGNTFNIEFNALGNDFENQDFPIIFEVTGNSQPEDYNGSTSPSSFTVNASTPIDGSIAFEITNDGVDESGETIVITLPKPTSNYEWANAEADGSLSFEIILTDAFLQTSTFSSAIVGANQDANGNYFVNEGDEIEIHIEANEINLPQGSPFTFEYQVSTTGDSNDYVVESSNPYTFTIDNTSNPDGKLNIKVNTDNFNDGGETITIVLQSNENVLWEDGYDQITDFYEDASFTFEIVDVPPIGFNIKAELENTGGTEGNGIQAGRDGAIEDGMGTDTFTLTLKNNDGSPYVTDQELVFQINFIPDPNPQNDGKSADESDFIIPTPSEIRIAPRTSSGSITVQLPQETEDDILHEYYLAAVTQDTESPQFECRKHYKPKLLMMKESLEFFIQLIVVTFFWLTTQELVVVLTIMLRRENQ